MKKSSKQSLSNSLRIRAERKLSEKGAGQIKSLAEGDALRLIHELEVHQVELEMQNEELRIAVDKAEAATKEITLLYDFAPTGYFTLDKNCLIKNLNLNGACIIGDNRSNLINRNFTLFIRQESLNTFNEFFQQVLESDQKQVCEVKFSVKNHSSIFVYLEGIGLGDNKLYLISAIDVTERRNIEETLQLNQIRLQELVATKDKFFSIIAHDLRGPFTAILGFTSLLQEQVKLKNYEKLDTYTAIVQESSWRAMNLLKNLLEWSRLQTGKIRFNPVQTDISALVDEVLELLIDIARQKNITIIKDVPGGMNCFVDREMISSVLRNLIGNAIKFTDLTGRVTIKVQQRSDEIIVIVSDNGIGIEKETVDKLFKVKETESKRGTQNEEGSGLGLLVSKEFVILHGGKIWVESEIGKGSSFYFTIPGNPKSRV